MNTVENIKKQKFLGKTGTVLFIILMNMFIPLSTDLYLPALPTMSSHFNASASLINLTLVSFFFFFAFGTIFLGPFCDKYGRRKVLILSSALYMLASACCALAPNVYVMIIARILQGISAGGIISASTVLVKDCFAGRQRETILAVVQSAAGVAPMLAPVLGALLLKITDWRGAFEVLTVAGFVCLVLSLLYQETLPAEERLQESAFASLGKLVKVGKNKGFILPCIIFSLYNFAFMGYISVSSYIYVDFFGLSEQMYSYFFAANALLSLLGPIIYVRFLAKGAKQKLVYTCFTVYLVAGAILLLFGQLMPLLFWIGFAPFTFCGALIRPFSFNLLLDQQEGDTGSASSLLNGIFTVVGSIGMMSVSLFSNGVLGLGSVVFVSGLISLLAWTLLMRSKITIIGLND
ncbi:MAG: Bcr/CflA family efflux MFS transporter [Peptococcaceae bacterium]|nr:Bcr/CflA family efflux MFS transporter [Peptococcaceae bacterium]